MCVSSALLSTHKSTRVHSDTETRITQIISKPTEAGRFQCPSGFIFTEEAQVRYRRCSYWLMATQSVCIKVCVCLCAFVFMCTIYVHDCFDICACSGDAYVFPLGCAILYGSYSIWYFLTISLSLFLSFLLYLTHFLSFPLSLPLTYSWIFFLHTTVIHLMQLKQLSHPFFRIHITPVKC